MARAADLELGDAAGGLLHADGAGVLAAGREEEVLDLVDLLRLFFCCISFCFGSRGGGGRWGGGVGGREREREKKVGCWG